MAGPKVWYDISQMMKRLLLTFVLFPIFFAGCTEPPDTKDLYGRWLHRTERQGLDFSEEGLLCRYSLSPQKLELFQYEMKDDDLVLRAVRSEGDSEELPVSLNNKTLSVTYGSGPFANYEFAKNYEDRPWPPLLGLWQADGSRTNEFLVFTSWGTVFGQKMQKESEEVQPIWAKFELSPGGTGSENDKKIGLWGLHGNIALSGSPQKISLDSESLRFDGLRYIRRKTVSELAK